MEMRHPCSVIFYFTMMHCFYTENRIYFEWQTQLGEEVGCSLHSPFKHHASEDSFYEGLEDTYQKPVRLEGNVILSMESNF